MLFQLWSSEIKNFSIEDVENNLWARQAGLDDKSLARSVNEFNLAFTKYGINSCMQKIVFWLKLLLKLFSLLPLGIIE
ncbi:hypothetical protein ETU08_07710 [Apibacter muscae]|nr:hypothetical protein [Apibacter muscae]TWP29166.1 hypothetical protein ETU08_07710 [Apibacter muscae]